MTKHRSVVTGWDPDYVNPDDSTGRPKGVQTAADMRVTVTYDVLAEGIFALHGIPTIIGSPVDTVQITPFMAAIESELGGFYTPSITDNEIVTINLANTGAVKVYVQQQDWEAENDLAEADSAVVFGVAYGANEIPAGALLLFESLLSGQTSTSGMTFTPAFKYTGAASGVIRVPTVAALPNVAALQTGIRALTIDGNGEYYYGADSQWHTTTVGNPVIATGWIPIPDVLTYQSWNLATRTGTINIPSNATLTYSPGMRVGITQSTGGAKYGIITKVASTLLTVFFPVGTTLNNQAITVPKYSVQKSPFGFPLEKEKWRVSVTYTTPPSTTSTASGVWKKNDGTELLVPIGSWSLSYKLMLVWSGSAGNYRLQATALSSNSSTPTNDFLKSGGSGGTPTGFSQWRDNFQASDNVTLESATTFYLLVRSKTGGSVGLINEDDTPGSIVAECAYL